MIGYFAAAPVGKPATGTAVAMPRKILAACNVVALPWLGGVGWFMRGLEFGKAVAWPARLALRAGRRHLRSAQCARAQI